jgi:flavin reductase (DIM6/NTAB) family NADH-FMN oxidoreductase RutF
VIGRLLERLDYPMTILTTAHGTERSGCLAGFGTQCSIHPARWLACVSKTNHTHGIAAEAESLVIHFLHDDQYDLAVLFGHETEDTTDKFARCKWRPGPYGIPVLDGCDWLAGRVVERIDFGDHTGHLIDITDAGNEHSDGPALGFQAVRNIRPGHPP